MKSFSNLRRSSLIVLLIISLCFILIKCIDRGNKNKDSSNENLAFDQYAGTESCAKCHRQIYDSFLTTGHFLSSQKASGKYMKGNFGKDSSLFHYSDKVFVKLLKTDSGYYQVKNENGVESMIGRIDIIIGSGIKGQTYLSWKDNHLYQLPVSYLTSTDSWVNNPGAGNFLAIGRTINARCLECHSTYAGDISPGFDGPFFNPHKILYCIACEKCHGPGAKHVEYNTNHPKEISEKYIINPATFSRQQSLDLCRSCHGGRIKNLKPAFTFKPGDSLKNYFYIHDNIGNSAPIDVHGDQYDLLAESKCFKMSSLTCVTCHNTHVNERGNLSLFSQRCMSCHTEEHGNFCKIKSLPAEVIKNNCIDCHMPAENSKLIVMKMTDSAKMKSALLRTHLINVYPEATKKFLAAKVFSSSGKNEIVPR
jgi:hypothetical protein